MGKKKQAQTQVEPHVPWAGRGKEEDRILRVALDVPVFCREDELMKQAELVLKLVNGSIHAQAEAFVRIGDSGAIIPDGVWMRVQRHKDFQGVVCP
jgi:hypothetical protein